MIFYNTEKVNGIHQNAIKVKEKYYDTAVHKYINRNI